MDVTYTHTHNQAAKDLFADIFEQIGYQQESPSVRNSFLAAAYELRSGIPSGATPKGTGPDLVRAMSTDLWIDFLGIRLDSKKAEGLRFTQGTRISRFDRVDLETVMAGQATMDD